MSGKTQHNNRRPERVQAVVLDWAGTAVDFGCIGPVAVFIEVFKKRGVEVTLSEARGPMGLMKKDHIQAMCDNEAVAGRWKKKHGSLPGPGDVEAMYRQAEALMIETLSKHAEPIPGCLRAIEAFREMGLKIGSCTGYTRPMMDVLAPASAKRGYKPDAVVTSTDVPAGRPHPYMCYLNAILLETYPLSAMVKIGDTLADVHEGRNAGMWTVGLTRTGNELGMTLPEVAAMEPRDLKRRLDEIEAAFRQVGVDYVVEGLGDCPEVLSDINHRLARGERPH